MSLAMLAAPFDKDNDNQNYGEFNSDDTPVNRKRLSGHNKTQKRIPEMDFNPEKVNSVLQSIHNNSQDDELGDFNPKRNQASATKPINPLTTTTKLLAPPTSMRTKDDVTEGFDNPVPKPIDNAELDLQELQSAFLNDAQVRDYYRKLVPNFKQKDAKESLNDINRMYYKERPIIDQQGSGGNDVLLNKINYMINLLEDQQDERTNTVTEEVILYSFLGIFIIFVVDSFARVSKYTR
jgi:hypothetical protein